MSAGGNDDIFAYNGASLVGYNADTGAKIGVGVDDVYDAILSKQLVLGNGSFSVEGAENPVVTHEDAGNYGAMTNNISDLSGRMTRVMSTYSSGGTADGSNATQAMLYVGNHDGSKEGASMLIGSSNNDSFIGGAGDEIITGSGRNDVRFRNTNDGGATLDQTNTGNRTTANNISGYDPLLNFIRVNESDLANITARFIDGALVVRNGRTTNTFITDNNQSAQLPADINDVLDIDLGEILAEDIVLGNGELSLDSRERHFDNAIVNTSINRKK